MRICHVFLTAILLSPLAYGCQSPQVYLPVKKGQENTHSAESFAPVVVGSVTEAGDLETRYNKIERGMKRTAVELILGRKSDQGLYPGGSLGDEILFWYEEKATISVWFQWGSGKAYEKSIKRCEGKQGPFQGNNDGSLCETGAITAFAECKHYIGPDVGRYIGPEFALYCDGARKAVDEHVKSAGFSATSKPADPDEHLMPYKAQHDLRYEKASPKGGVIIVQVRQSNEEQAGLYVYVGWKCEGPRDRIASAQLDAHAFRMHLGEWWDEYKRKNPFGPN